MLSKKEKASHESPDRLNRIVEGTKIIGEVIAESNLRIDGEIQGNVSCAGKLVLGENGKIVGNLICNEADIEGTIHGDVEAETLLRLREKSLIVGNLKVNKLEIDQGAQFNGQCEMKHGSSSAKGVPVQNRKNQPEDIVY